MIAESRSSSARKRTVTNALNRPAVGQPQGDQKVRGFPAQRNSGQLELAFTLGEIHIETILVLKVIRDGAIYRGQLQAWKGANNLVG
jgi:hypothetical protein